MPTSHDELDSFVFQISAVNAGKPVPKGVTAGQDYTVASYFGLSLLAHAGLIGALAFFVPPIGITDDGDVSQERILMLQAYLNASAEREQEARETEDVSEENSDESEGGEGQRAQGENQPATASAAGGSWISVHSTHIIAHMVQEFREKRRNSCFDF